MAEQVTNDGPVQRTLAVPRMHKDLFPMPREGTLLNALLRKEVPAQREAASKQGTMPGRRYHPFDMQAVIDFDDANEYHSACISAKVGATVGLGFVTEAEKEYREKVKQLTLAGDPPLLSVRDLPEPEKTLAKVDKILNPLCRISWMDTLLQVGQDFEHTGAGYLEIVRNDQGKITGIHHIPAPSVYIFLEDNRGTHHFEVEGFDGVDLTPLRFAPFGQKEEFLQRLASPELSAEIQMVTSGEVDRDSVSEVIQIRMPSSKDRWYGRPTWLSCVATIELMQMMMQHNFDYYLNRGVPEMMLFFKGISFGDTEWKAITDALKNHIGLGNTFKTLALQIPEFSDNADIQIERIGESSDTLDKLSSSRENLATGIVSAHKVPPLLAGIQIPGKLGATNELPNALMAFQLLCIRQRQLIFYQALGSTLADPRFGVEGLSPEDFELKKITDEIDVGTMDTVSRMRQSPMQAKNEGRDLKAGTKD
jgi:hypothetical protein